MRAFAEELMESEFSNARSFGGSTPVENVQALAAAKDLKEIPHRYIRPDLQSDYVSVDESPEIPVIDLTKLQDEQFASDELAKFHAACKDWGFFQLINHRVPEEIVEKMKTDIQEFFKLPLEVKRACSQLPNYIEGYGQAFVVSEEQELDWADMLYVIALPVAERKMRFWPTSPTSFRETLDNYSLELQRLIVCLTGLMAKNLGVESEELTGLFENGSQGIRMNYYPPCRQADKVVGLSPHSDPVGITLLIQVNEVEGLQIRKNSYWVPVKPIEGAFIVNIGDLMEILSNGEYKSIEHRAVVDSEKERLSVATFTGPNFSAMIRPLPNLVKENGERYKTILHEDYMKQVFASKLDGKKSTLDFMKMDN